jgi:cold shock CspA family protein
MQLPIQISERGCTLTAEQRTLLQREAGKLERFYPRISACRVLVTVPAHQARGVPATFQVRLDLTVPQGELAVTHLDRPSLAEAAQDAFDAAARRLQDYAREQRTEVKRHEGPSTGTVTRLSVLEGFGFITAPDGEEIYFHRNSVPDGFERLEEGMDVRFVESAGEKGPQASTVVPLHAARQRRRGRKV